MARVASSAPPGKSPTFTPEEVERLYREYRHLLLYVAMQKFGVPASDAEMLLQEALLALFMTDEVITNPKAWVVAVMCNGSRNYWRQRERKDRVEGAMLSLAEIVTDDLEVERIERKLVLKTVLSLLPAADRTVLRLHYFEQLTAAKVGERLGTTRRYAEKRISTALQRARDVYAALHPRTTSVEHHAETLKSG